MSEEQPHRWRTRTDLSSGPRLRGVGDVWRIRCTGQCWLGLLLILIGVKGFLAWQLPLFGDEAFYWLESRHLAVAYDDVPPLTPWLIRLGTGWAGQEVWAVRWPFLLLSLASVWMVHHIAGVLAGRQAAALATGLSLLVPLFAANGLLALPDVPLTFAVLVCVEGLRRLLSNAPHAVLWLASGLALGWWSHYRFLVPVLAAGLWLLLHPAGRHLLRHRAIWVAGLTGHVLGLAPLFWHQWRQAGEGFAFQYLDRHPWRFQPEALLDPFWQLLVTTPVLAIVVIWGVVRASRDRTPALAMVGGIAGLLLLTWLLAAPFVDAERSRLHWPMQAFVLASIAAAPMLLALGRRARRWVCGAAIVALPVLLAGSVYLGVVARSPQTLAAGDAYLHGFSGWREAAAEVSMQLAEMSPDTVLAADNFMLAAQLAFAHEGRRVYSLDHPINRKHGRQSELVRWGLDESALLRTAEQHPVLLVIEESASSLRARPDWFRRVCERFPAAQRVFDEPVDQGRKRLIGYRQQPGSDVRCVPPPVASLNWPLSGDRVSGELAIDGWALQDRVGLVALHATLDGQPLGALMSRDPDPGVGMLFPGSDDPRHPDVGFSGTFTPSLPAGRYWLQIEAESSDGRRSVVASASIHWRPR